MSLTFDEKRNVCLEQIMIKTIKCVHQKEKLMFCFCATYYRLHWIEYDNNMKSLICTYEVNKLTFSLPSILSKQTKADFEMQDIFVNKTR